MSQQLRSSELPSVLERLRARRTGLALLSGLCVATAQLSAETITLSFAWLGARATLVRVLGSALFALVIGVLARRVQQTGDAPLTERPLPMNARHHPENPSFRSWWSQLQQALDADAGWLVLGLLLSAALEAALTPQLLELLPQPWDALLCCIVALLTRVSALGMTPIVAVLLHKGLHLGAGLTLLWLSPLASLPLALWLGPKPSLRHVLVGSAALTALGVALAQLVERTLTKDDVPELHPLVTHDCSIWEYACAGILAALVIRSLMRLGPRGFAGAKPGAVGDRSLCAVQH